MSLYTPNTIILSDTVNDEFEYSLQTKNHTISDYFKYSMASNLVPTAATWTKMQFNSSFKEDLTHYDNYDSADCCYTTPVAGVYRFILSALMLSQSAQPFLIALGYNSAVAEWRRLAEIPNTTGNITISGLIEETIPAGVKIYALCYSTSASKTISANLTYTRFMGRLVNV